VTLTPWEPQEIWPLLAAALAHRPALIAPFVTRPGETVLDRVALGLAAPEEATTGLYCLRRPRGTADVTVVLQESAVAYAFVTEALPLLEREGVDARVYYVASAELFDSLPLARRRALFPEEHAWAAIGITGFTLPTLYRWVRCDAGREATLHPYRKGHYLGSGQGDVVLAEAGLDGESQFVAIKKYVDDAVRRARRGGGA
jgi:transketolase